MTEKTFESSDAVRTSKPLQYAQFVTFREPLNLEHGEMLPEVTVCYETYGTLNAARDNAVLICHALSGDSHVVRHHPDDEPGWWDTAPIVGPGLPIDTNHYFVICPNVLGGCRGTTGPGAVNPATGQRYAGDFPVITTADIVAVQKKLVDHLGITKLLAVVGGSMGGHQVLTWATKYPHQVAGAVALATSPRLTAQALAFDIVGRNAIISDPHFNGGDYYTAPSAGPMMGLAVARMLAHITYLSPQSMDAKFEPNRLQPRKLQTDFETKFSVGSYLAYQGHRFVERFDANSYNALTMAMDLFDLGMTPPALAENLSRSVCRWLVMSFSSDWLFPPFQSQEIVNALLTCHRPVSYANITSTCGHDAFLLPNDLDRYGELLRHFLANLNPAALLPDNSPPTPAEDNHSLTSIFHGHRFDYDLLQELIPPDVSVLDLGCGSGTLLARLKKRGHGQLMGIEWDENELVACAKRGLDVVHADLNLGLPSLSDNRFDYVILSQTLQTVRDVEKVLDSMLRVGRKGIVSFPNFAYGPIRQELLEKGRAPRGSKLLSFQWYNSPNIRFLSIADFEDFCRDKGITIHQQIALDTSHDRRVEDNPNLNADTAIFVLSR